MCWWTVSPLLVAPAEMGATRAVYSSTHATGEAASASQICLHRVPAAGAQGKPTRAQAPPWGLAFWGHGPPCCPTGLAACEERGPSPCAPWPCFRAPASLFPLGGSSPAPPASLLRQTPCKPLSVHIPAVPALPPAAAPGPGGSDSLPNEPRGLSQAVTKPDSGAHPDRVPCGPLRKPIHPISPGEKTRRQVEQM